MATGAAFPALPLSMPAEASSMRRIALAFNYLLQGKQNNVITVTLAANVTTTVINDSRIGVGSSLQLGCPLTANAAAAIATTWISSRGKQTATLTHANNAQTDRTWAVEITG